VVTIINPPTRPAKIPASANGNGSEHHTSSRLPSGTGGDDGGGGKHGGNDGDGWDDFQLDATRSRIRIGMIVLLVTILMMFASLTIAYLVLSNRPNWQSIELPAQLWVSTAFIILSSVAFELARRAWKRESIGAAQRWILTTVALGASFVVSQVVAWRELAEQGIYRQTNPYRSFIFLLTGIHAIHIIGGIFGLVYLTWRVRRRVVASSSDGGAAIDAGAMYWHFIDGLWVYVFMLLLLWR